MQEYADQLPDEARRYVDVIRSNVGQMGRLIDDLLQFSRTERLALESQKVNMADLVKVVLLGLQSEQEGRSVKVVVAELPNTRGDSALLTQVWQNLIANALKFTGKRENARIDIGSQRANGEVIYFVKDNGAGFNMAYADNLFGVFHRLHREEDFEGTGVGLATVKRIIQRHGGRIWADAEEDKGATFYFTVGKGVAGGNKTS
jgi:light-regulated signal transduction histidine kinase (bacteriophytochrome)